MALLYRPAERLGLSATMNLERVSNEEKLNLCRKYYLGKGRFLGSQEKRGDRTRAPEGREPGAWILESKG